jgi:hypothetical protein
MPTVVPSQILMYIDTTLSDLVNATPSQGSVPLQPSTCGALNALLRLIEQLPNHLLPSDPNLYAAFIQNQESIRFAVKQAENHNFRAYGPLRLEQHGPDKRNQVQIIRAALFGCPDEVPPQRSNDLPFIGEASFRRTLLIDLETSRSAIIHGEWKAATVLAGSLALSMLLWSIQQKPAEIQGACGRAVAGNKLQKNPPSDPLDWALQQLIEVAEEMKLIEPDTAKQTRLAKDFRNLIHPGRMIRMQQSCDRGTALAASAAVELIARDLQARFP